MQSSFLSQYIVYRCVVGSQAYGLAEAGSDVDRRGFFVPPAEQHWSLASVPEQIVDDVAQECYWEVQKFLTLALKGNPTILECLYTPLVEMATPLAHELLTMRHIFLSRRIYGTYNGYVQSQFTKLAHYHRTRGEIRWKHGMHLTRLLLAGITALREGYVPVRVDTYREQLLAIRHGRLPWDEVDAWRLALHKQLDQAFTTTTLPENPDYDQANVFLIKARRSMLNV